MLHARLVLLIATFAALVLGGWLPPAFTQPVGAKKLDDVKKSVRETLKNASATPQQKVDAVRQLVAFNSTPDAKAAVKELLAILDDKTLISEKDQKKAQDEFNAAETKYRAIDAKIRHGDRLEFGAGLPSQSEYEAARAAMEAARSRLSATMEIKQALVAALAQMTSADARVEILAGLKAAGPDSVCACVLALKSFGGADVFDAVAQCYDANTDPGVRAVCVPTLRQLDATKALPYLLKALNDDNCWLGRSLAVAALRTVRTVEVIDALVNRLGKEGPGRLRWDIVEALTDLTGKTLGEQDAAWRSWWAGAKSGFKPPAKSAQPATPPKHQGANSTGPAFYDVPVHGNPLFIIDRSGSMLESSRPGSPAARAGQPLPAGEKSKWQVLQAQMIGVINALPETTKFAIVWFDSEVEAYKNGAILTATPAEKAEVVKAVNAMVASRFTNIYGAFERGFDIIRGVGGSAPKVVLTGKGGTLALDEIFFMTDGSPTVGTAIDGISPTNDPNADSNIKYVGKLLDKICNWNAAYNLPIQCICVGDGDDVFLKKLANRSRGSFKKVE